MAQLIIDVDDDVLRHARSRARELGRSIDDLLISYLEDLVDGQSLQQQAIDEIHRLADGSESGSSGHSWTRGDLYDRLPRP